MIGIVILLLVNLILWFTVLMIGFPGLRKALWQFLQVIVYLALGILCLGTAAAIVVLSVASKL